jgi:hypothetical protein
MTTEQLPERATENRPRNLLLFLMGIVLFIVGPIAYFIQLRIPRFDVPWYMPILSTIGVLLMTVSAGAVWRKIVLMLFLVLCGLEWYFMVEFAKTPVYSGPAKIGQKLPALHASFADGKDFTQGDLEKGKRSAIIFFRGKW